MNERRSSVPDPILGATFQLLADGAARTADQLVTLGIARGLYPATLTHKQLYTDLYEYITRTLGAGRVPEITRDDQTLAFRLNQPADSWPAIGLPACDRWIDDAVLEAAIAAVTQHATGDDTTAFEQAVCDGFALLGYRATHLGGNGAPDGILDAQLGAAAYRIVLECKTARAGDVVSNPRPEEPASFLSAYHGDKALLIGPAFADDASFHAELVTHGTALWTTDDLVSVLRAQMGPLEMLPALVAGVAHPAIERLLWERDHGRRKRLAVIADRAWRAAWQAQVLLSSAMTGAQAPELTRDALLLLVDEQLANEGVTGGVGPVEFDAACAELSARGVLQPHGPSALTAAYPPAPSGAT